MFQIPQRAIRRQAVLMLLRGQRHGLSNTLHIGPCHKHSIGADASRSRRPYARKPHVMSTASDVCFASARSQQIQRQLLM